ncbi:MAG: GSU2403 family nucleotidyltransferase fold protein, partial [Bradymonadaceae bacterium]
LADVHGEFLVPLVGSRTDRDGNPKSPQEFQEGLTAEALRFLDLLLWQPRTFDLQKIEVLDVSSVLTVQLPRLGAYVIQKALCSERRDEADKRDKDLAYIYDVATLSHGRWEEIRDEIEELRSTKSEWKSWIAKAGEILDDAFRAESGAGPEVVARVYEKATTSVNPESVDRILSRFLREVNL